MNYSTIGIITQTFLDCEAWDPVVHISSCCGVSSIFVVDETMTLIEPIRPMIVVNAQHSFIVFIESKGTVHAYFET